MTRICVDNISNPDSVAYAIKALKRMARYGKLAERALADLKEQGFCDRPAPIVYRDPTGRLYVQARRFPAHQEVSRADVPGWGEWSTVMGKVEDGKHGGVKFRQASLWISGRGLSIDANGAVQETVLGKGEHASMIGQVRLLKKRVTLLPVSRLGNEVLEMSYVVRIAELIGKLIMRKSADVKPLAVPQKMVDLIEAVPKWLVEDGIAASFIKQIHDGAEVLRVMDA